MKNLVFILSFVSIALMLVVSCTTRKNTNAYKNDLIFHKKLSDSIVIDISNLAHKRSIIKHVSIDPLINVTYTLDKNKKTIFIKPVTKFEELTKYTVTIKSGRKYYKYNFLTAPDKYITLTNLKCSPKTWLDSKTMKFSKDSVPTIKMKDKYVINPTTICQFAISCYDDYILNNNPISKNYFLKQVDYLTKNNTKMADGIGFPYYFETQSLKPPWFSALAQGQAVSVFVRAFFLTKDSTYLALAKKSINYMISKFPDGTLNYTSDSLVWLEEYPKKTPSSVLNGYVFSIFGLIEYSKLFPEDTVVSKITRTCLNALKKGIPFYDTGKWLIYDRERKSMVSYHYMGMQVNQMMQMYQTTKDTAFLNLYNKWEKYINWDEWVNGKKVKQDTAAKKPGIIKKDIGNKGMQKIDLKKSNTLTPPVNKPEFTKPELAKPQPPKPEEKKVEIK